jgi:hypothetical protein
MNLRFQWRPMIFVTNITLTWRLDSMISAGMSLILVPLNVLDVLQKYFRSLSEFLCDRAGSTTIVTHF